MTAELIHVRSLATFASRFQVGDKVRIDEGDMVAVVCAHLFRGGAVTLECSWFANGVYYLAWIEEWRLSLVE